MKTNITGNTKTFGLFGDRVHHSFSPYIQNITYEALNLDAVYLTFNVSPQNLETAVNGAYSMGIRGLNITVPYKNSIIPFLSEEDISAKKVAAVNVLKYSKNGYIGYNTDFLGIKKTFDYKNIVIKNKNIVILGAGGAAYAAAIAVCEQAAKKITIINRSIETAKNIATHVKKIYNIDVSILTYENLKDVKEKDVIIQTTSLGFGELKDLSPIEDSSFFRGAEIVFDIIYSPWKTRFLNLALAENCYCINGFDMLVFQALASIEIWNDIKLEETFYKEILEKSKNFFINDNKKESV